MNDEVLSVQAERDSINAETKKLAGEFNVANQEVVAYTASFYKYIGSLSAGAIVASISFLGSLTSEIGTVELYLFNYEYNNFYFLYTAWFLLLICMFTALYKGQVTMESKHYLYNGKWAKLKGEDNKNVSELYRLQLVANPNQEHAKELPSLIKDYESVSRTNHKRYEFASLASMLCGHIADVSFILGIATLVIFGITSLSVK
ncbi:MAG: hypothetical protein WCV88_05700 [Patescibacteria group bacterium]|jgi:hypothetical protein